MSATLAPEVFFDLREIIEVVERIHASLRFALSRRSCCGPRGARDGCFLRSRYMTGRLISFPDNSQPFQREKFVHLLNMPRGLRDQRRLPARSNHARIFVQRALDALQNSVD